MTVCRLPGMAHYQDGDVLKSGSLFFEYARALDKNAINTTTDPYFLTQSPDLSDLLAEMRYESNMTTIKINSTDVESREIT